MKHHFNFVELETLQSRLDYCYDYMEEYRSNSGYRGGDLRGINKLKDNLYWLCVDFTTDVSETLDELISNFDIDRIHIEDSIASRQVDIESSTSVECSEYTSSNPLLVECPRGPYYVWEEFGQFKGSTENPNARIVDARRIQTFDDFDSLDEVVEYVSKYF